MARFCFISALILLLVFWGRRGEAISLQWDQADIIWTEEHSPFYGFPNAQGDFNGDGKKDMVFIVTGKASIVLGKSFGPSSSFGTVVDWTIFFPDATDAESVQSGDLNGDGKDDLIFGFPDYQTAAGRVLVVFGRGGAGGAIDLAENPADVTIRGQNGSNLGMSLAVGNFNGDDYQDALIGVEGYSKVYVLWGAPVISPNNINLNSGGSLFHITGPNFTTFGEIVSAGDINGDGKSEAVISAWNDGASGLPACGVVYVVWGSTAMATSPQLRINGTANAGMEAPGLGDFDGDDRADILTRNKWGTSQAFWTSALMGDWFPTVSTTVNTSSGHPGYLAGVGVGVYGEYPYRPFPPTAVGDFDGDGRADVAGVELNSILQKPLRAFLSSSHPGEWSPGSIFNEPSMEINLNGVGLFDKRVAMGDVNNDGLADLLVTRIMDPSYSKTQYLVFYGFRPLWNASVEVSNPAVGARIDLVLSVDGDPVEMKLGGHILDSFKDQWIPFAAHHQVTLSPDLGSKTVTAVFRNATRRESDPAAATVTLDAGSPGGKSISNRVRPGGRAVVECSMESSGRLRASVWTSDGTKVVDLVDEDRGPGVWTLEWDGNNPQGKRVSPGVYLLRMEINGHLEQKKILVQG